MKKETLLLFLLCIALNPAFAQKTVYNSSHQKKEFVYENAKLKVVRSKVQLDEEQLAPFLVAAIPIGLDLGFKLTTKMLEKRAKSFAAEYTAYGSYEKISGALPSLSYTRKVILEKSTDTVTALAIDFQPVRVEGAIMNRFIYYSLSKFELNLSSARSTSHFNTFDYTIELILDCMAGTERKEIAMKPIVISSAKYQQPNIQNENYRSDFIRIPDNGIILGASIKVVETNPGKVRAEKILAAWNDNKEGARTIINNFLPSKEDKKQESATTTDENNDENENSDQTTSNRPDILKDAKKTKAKLKGK